MTNKLSNVRKLWLSLAALTLGGVAITSTAAAVSPESFFTAFRNNSAGTTFFQIAPSAGHFCYLSRVTMNELDASDEVATCRVNRGSSAWTLEATLAADGNADVRCSAYCYNN